MIDNLRHAVEVSCVHGLALACDGTYRLIRGGWAFLILGFNVVIFDRNGDSRLSFRPIVLTVTLVENEISFKSLFEGLHIIALKYLNIENLKVERLIIDHSFPEFNACNETLYNAFGLPTEIICCNVHVERKVISIVSVTFVIFSFP
jgi:hypothetical protein